VSGKIGPHRLSWDVSTTLEAFSLTGRPPRNVHICGEAFSDFQGFMEGALRSAQSALGKALDPSR